MGFEDETTEFWLRRSCYDVAETAAVLHRERRASLMRFGAEEVSIARRTVGAMVLKGSGVEVGAGDRPWPLPAAARCFYGDIRDGEGLRRYFGTSEVSLDRQLDAQSFAGIPDASFDFVISAHVIEHLENPLGAVRATMRVLKSGGTALLAVPDMRFTFDRNRPAVTLEHLLADEADAGAGTRLQAFLEHVRFVHPITSGGETIPEGEELGHARANSAAGLDIHFHAWTGDGFRDQMLSIANGLFSLEAHVPVQNESIFVLRKS